MLFAWLVLARTPTISWADRNDRLFLAVHVPRLAEPEAALLRSGLLSINASSRRAEPPETYALRAELHGEVDTVRHRCPRDPDQHR